MIDAAYNIIFEDLFQELFQNTHPNDVRKRFENELLTSAKDYYSNIYPPYATSSKLESMNSLTYLEEDMDGELVEKPIRLYITEAKKEYKQNERNHLKNEFALLLNYIKGERQPRHHFILEDEKDIKVYRVFTNKKTIIRKDFVKPDFFEITFIHVLNNISSIHINAFLEAQLLNNFNANLSAMNTFLVGIISTHSQKLKLKDSEKLKELIQFWLKNSSKPTLKEPIESQEIMKVKSSSDYIVLLYELGFIKIDTSKNPEPISDEEVLRIKKFTSFKRDIPCRTIKRYCNGIIYGGEKDPTDTKKYPSLKSSIQDRLNIPLLSSILAKEVNGQLSEDDAKDFWNNVKNILH